uniref:Uncharacterized protein n=1 Tax=Geobacter metallireducens TaxID=28232 RepID=A0A831TZE8_GEOME
MPLFRKVRLLAHPLHLKSKDIFEGGFRMVVVLDATDLTGGKREADFAEMVKGHLLRNFPQAA